MSDPLHGKPTVHKHRLCQCEECARHGGRELTYWQWRWHVRQRATCGDKWAAARADLSRPAAPRAAAEAAAPPAAPAPAATSTLASATTAAAAARSTRTAADPFGSPSARLLAQAERIERIEQFIEAQRHGQYRGTPASADPAAGGAESHTLPAPAFAAADPGRPLLPPPPACRDDDDDDDSFLDGAAGFNIEEAAPAAAEADEDALPSSQASRLSLVRALVNDFAAATAGQDQPDAQPVDADADSLQSLRSGFVLTTYIFVMYLMAFHGLSNAVATIILSFVANVLARFCVLYADASAAAAAAGARLSPPPAPSAHDPPSPPMWPPPCPSPPPPPPPPSSPPSSGLGHESLSQLQAHTQSVGSAYSLSGFDCTASSSPPHHAEPTPPPPFPMLVSPVSVRSRLGMHADFDQYLVCARCGRLTAWREPELARTARQILCGCGAALLHNRTLRPVQLYCHRTLESIFSSVLMDARYYKTLQDWMGVVEAAEAACATDQAEANATSTTASGTDESRRPFSEVPTGSAWLEDCSSAQAGCRRRCQQPGRHLPFVAGPMNLKLTLSVDWFGPHKGKFHEWHSTGAVLVRVDNLPARLTTHDRRCLGTHLVGLLPGPKEVDAGALQKILQLVVDKLKVFDANGKVIGTHGHPEGELFKARLHLVVADTPARNKVAGFATKYQKGTICAYCPKQGERLGLTDEEEDEESDSFVGSQRPARRRTAAGYRAAAVHQLDYFDAVDGCPPDMMHAIHLGMCKRFWLNFLILACNDIGKRLPEAQSVINNALLPSHVQRPSKTLGDRGGGSPTAEQWEVLFRILLPFVLMQIWTTSLCGYDDEELTFSPPASAADTRTRAARARDEAAALVEVFAEDADADADQTDSAHLGNRATVPSDPDAMDLDADDKDSVYGQAGADVDVEGKGLRSSQGLGKGGRVGRLLKPGQKGVRSVFRSAMVLCAIVDLVSGDLDGAQVDQLACLIGEYNRSQAKLLGSAWLTFNSHVVTHLPHFIKRLGSPRHFSSIPFERYNGVLGSIPTSGHKGGTLEATLMRNAAQRMETRRLLASSGVPWFETRLLESIEGESSSLPPQLTPATRLKARRLANDTLGLLCDHLNGRGCRPSAALGLAPAVAAASAADQPATTSLDALATTMHANANAADLSANTAAAAIIVTAKMPQHVACWDHLSRSDVLRLDAHAKLLCIAKMRGASGGAVSVGSVRQGQHWVSSATISMVVVAVSDQPATTTHADADPAAISANTAAAAATNPSQTTLQYIAPWDQTSRSDVLRLDAHAELIRTAKMRGASGGAVSVGGVGQGGRDNRGNCYCLVSVDGERHAAKILWIFTKAMRVSVGELDLVPRTFMHVQLLREVGLEVALGRLHPRLELMRVMGVRLALVDDDCDDVDDPASSGEELVVDLSSWCRQLAAVPFCSNGRRLLGLKLL